MDDFTITKKEAGPEPSPAQLNTQYPPQFTKDTSPGKTEEVGKYMVSYDDATVTIYYGNTHKLVGTHDDIRQLAGWLLATIRPGIGGTAPLDVYGHPGGTPPVTRSYEDPLWTYKRQWREQAQRKSEELQAKRAQIKRPW